MKNFCIILLMTTAISLNGDILKYHRVQVEEEARYVADQLGVDEIEFDFYSNNSNSRASARGNQISFNESRIYEIPSEERERVIAHELQHVLNFREYRVAEKPELSWGFAFHPSLVGLYQRMNDHYLRYKDQGYPFVKGLKIPTSLQDWGTSSENYCHPDELLALLRGYSFYINQIKDGRLTTPEPYEFIDAFTTQDLILLDINVRSPLSQEVVAGRSDIRPIIMAPIKIGKVNGVTSIIED